MYDELLALVGSFVVAALALAILAAVCPTPTACNPLRFMQRLDAMPPAYHQPIIVRHICEKLVDELAQLPPEMHARYLAVYQGREFETIVREWIASPPPGVF